MTDVESVIDEVEKQLTVKMIKQVKKDKENGKKEIITMTCQDLIQRYVKLIKLLKK